MRLKSQPLKVPSLSQTALPPTGASADDWSIDPRPLLAYRYVFVAVVLATLAIVGAVTALSPKQYTATAKMLVGDAGTSAPGRESATLLPILNALVSLRGQQSAETYAELLQERPIAQQVAADLGLRQTPKDLLASVSVKPVSNTSVLAVSATAASAARAAGTANDFARVFVDRERRLVMDNADQALHFLASEIPKAARSLRVAQSSLAAYETRFGLPDIAAQTQSLLAQSSALDARIAQEEVNQAQAAAQLASVGAALARVPANIAGTSTTVPNPLFAQLTAQRSQLTIQLNAARAQYTNDHPAIVALRQQLDSVSGQLAKTPTTIVADRSSIASPLRTQLEREAVDARTSLEAAKAASATLHAQRSTLDAALARLPAQTQDVARLRSGVTLAQNVYDELQQKRTEATVAKTTALSDVTVIAPATAQDALRHPSLIANLLLGCALGIVLGLVCVYALTLLDNTVKDERQAIAAFGLPVLATIPSFDGVLPGARRRALPRNAGPLEAPAAPTPSARLAHHLSYESFLELVASLRYASEARLRSICLSSPEPGAGTSTVALNAAIALAEFDGPVLLVDANMRRPALYGGMRTRKVTGLSDVLAGVAPLSAALGPSTYPGLDLVVSGSHTPSALKLLQSESFARFVAETSSAYRCVVFDAPPLSTALDAAVIAEHVDGTVLVVAAGETHVPAVTRALERLRSVGTDSITGIVVNRAAAQHKSDMRFLETLADGHPIADHAGDREHPSSATTLSSPSRYSTDA